MSSQLSCFHSAQLYQLKIKSGFKKLTIFRGGGGGGSFGEGAGCGDFRRPDDGGGGTSHKKVKNVLAASAQSFLKCFYIKVHKLDTQSRNKASPVRKSGTTEKNEIFCLHSFELPQKNQCTMTISSWHPIYTQIKF